MSINTAPSTYVVFGDQRQSGTGTHPTAVAVGPNFNGDLIPDVIVANSAGVKSGAINTVTVDLGKYDNSGHWVVGSSQTYVVGLDPQAIATADFNGDGLDDAVTANAGTYSVSVLIDTGPDMNKAYTFGVVNFAVGHQPEGVATGDLNGDGRPDIVTTNDNDNTVSVLLNNGGPATIGSGTTLVGNPALFAPQITYATGSEPFAIQLADVNHDGKLDIVETNQHDNTVGILLGNGDGSFKPVQTFAVGTRPIGLYVADINGDGKLDVITANYDSNNISILLGNGDGTFAAQFTDAVGNKPDSVGAADLNGDGLIDLAVANYADSTTTILLGNGDATFQPAVTFTSGPHPFGLILYDLELADTVTTTNGFLNTLNNDILTCDFSSSQLNVEFPILPNFTTLVNGVLTVTGTSANDSIALTTNHGNISITLNGIDSQSGGQNGYLVSQVTSIVVFGLAGNDIIQINAQIPGGLVSGGPGNDTIIIQNIFSDTVGGGPGSDSIQANVATGNDFIHGGNGADTIIGGTGNNTLFGNAGPDSIVAGVGANSIDGGTGADTLFGSNAASTVYDTIIGGAGSDSIVAGPMDLINGGGGDSIFVEQT